MAKKQKKGSTNEIVDLLKKLLMIELQREGVRQNKIRDIVGGGMGEVNKFLKLLVTDDEKKKKKTRPKVS